VTRLAGAIEALGAEDKETRTAAGLGSETCGAGAHDDCKDSPQKTHVFIGTAGSCKKTHESYVGEAEEGREEDGIEFRGSILAFKEW
jgi:hypothetical protein